MSDDVRTCTCYKKTKIVAVIMSRKMKFFFGTAANRHSMQIYKLHAEDYSLSESFAHQDNTSNLIVQ